ncbi:MAG: 2-oxoacid:ferredoxin oxidoreductase subunit beta [Planctomycetes bacterium]|nr:2-oxoacid:ferredoxin oxidoreductase subunit beta [Planctomycetota bacterium]NUQ34923.1 2-oxoacid:ferredoxin oxidoreductase subunit beta [Planctomycetaceae bacterium]
MSETTTPAAAPKAPATNRINRARKDYEGAKSTLCIGCGHDLITRYITDAFWNLGIEPHRVAKMSGIGCSSKTPAYFLGKSWGFNSVHGRMPSVATGAKIANRSMMVMGVSGDGDTASIGMGQFVHLVRRNSQCLYIVENNGVYGLTKGQFSATSDLGAKKKDGDINLLHSIDLCSLAIELGCGFVARAFAGNMKQMQAVIQAAAMYPGLALVDVISPCVTFNNFEFSKYGFDYMKDHQEIVNDFGFVPSTDHVEAAMEPGETKDVAFPDGSKVRFKVLPESHDPSNRIKAIELLHEAYEKSEILTGLFYLDFENKPFSEAMGLVDQPLASLQEPELRPSAEVLATIMDRHA